MSGTKIPITDTIALDSEEITFSFVRASGPGGQNVNKVSSAVQLRFDLQNAATLTDDVKSRLLKIAGQRATKDGAIVIEAKRFRTQTRNRKDALDRLAALIRQALHKDKIRRQSRPSVRTKQKRLDRKRKHGDVKRMRRTPAADG